MCMLLLLTFFVFVLPRYYWYSRDLKGACQCVNQFFFQSAEAYIVGIILDKTRIRCVKIDFIYKNAGKYTRITGKYGYWDISRIL